MMSIASLQRTALNTSVRFGNKDKENPKKSCPFHQTSQDIHLNRSNSDYLKAASKFFRKGSVGCQFAKIVANQTANNKAGLLGWKQEIVDQPIEDIIKEGKLHPWVNDTVQQETETPKNGLVTMIFPKVKTPTQLAKLVEHLGSKDVNGNSFYVAKKLLNLAPLKPAEAISKTKNHSKKNWFYSIPLRLQLNPGEKEASQKKVSFPLIFGNFPFFSPTRKSEDTLLVFRPTDQKSNPETPETQLGPDDFSLNLNSTMHERAMKQTQKVVPETRGSFNRELFRARSTTVLPKSLGDRIMDDLRFE